MKCGCRCVHCKSNDLESFTVPLENDDFDIHHTCRGCGIHFNHLDGETYEKCDKCAYER
jgi:predicted Zn-ribbon and HTH transcriptional regulator